CFLFAAGKPMAGFPHRKAKTQSATAKCVFLILLQIIPNLLPPTRFFCLPFLTVFLLISARQVRSEEHTSELQSRFDLVCRLLLALVRRFLHPFPTRRSSDLLLFICRRQTDGGFPASESKNAKCNSKMRFSYPATNYP